MTSISNDYGYEQVFARQLEALATAGDIFIGISTSGSSGNILAAIDKAKEKGVATIGLTGAGGKMSEICDICLNVPSSHTPHIQESHITIGHILCGLIERTLFPNQE
jgi:D-sedoheptulose 7-phosphate isomerase